MAGVAVPRKTRLLVFLCALSGLLILGIFTWRTPAVGFAHYAARGALKRYELHVALSWLEWAEQVDGRDPTTLLLLGRTQGKLGDLSNATAFIERARQAGCDSELCRRETWLLQARYGRFRDAEPHFSELLADPRGDQAEIGEALFLAYRAARRFSRAKQVLDAWQADDPKDPQPHFLRGMLFADAGFSDLAENAYRDAVDLQPTHEPASLALAQTLVQRHHLSEALAYYRPCLERRPESEVARLGVARCYRLQGRLQESREVLSIKPDERLSSELTAELGAVEVAAGNYEVAVQLLESAYEELPHFSHVRQQLALALAGAGRHQQAAPHFAFLDLEHRHRTRIRELAAIVNGDVGNTEARVALGKLLIELQADEEALSWLYGALDVDPSLLAAHLVLADFYDRRSNTNPKYVELASHHRSFLQPDIVVQPDID
ncbi:MAG TPA: tetratricopeptide repeat protein [Pirellulaceae bacterium]|nr:tetratricopeptide repeat protein [Pirellulaceae bacterium]